MAENSFGPTRDRPEVHKPQIVVIGSITMDLVVRASIIPQAGQTITGHSFATIPSGKGANQAVAAARAGANVSIIGRVGNDDFGQRLLCNLRGHGVDISSVMITEGVSTGIAMSTVDDNGENATCLSSGANTLLSCEDIDDHADIISQADVVLMQLEIPQKTVVYALAEIRRLGIPMVLNPAPIPDRIDSNLFEADVLIVNQGETSKLCGEPVSDVASAKLAGAALFGRGAKNVVVTLGRRGVLAITVDSVIQLPPFATKLVDTSGAGDALCGAFAVAYAQDRDLQKAARFGLAAASLACGRFGSQPSMPHIDAITTLLQRHC